LPYYDSDSEPLDVEMETEPLAVEMETPEESGTPSKKKVSKKTNIEKLKA